MNRLNGSDQVTTDDARTDNRAGGNCGGCQWWMRDGANIGTCRAAPPTPMLGQRRNILSNEVQQTIIPHWPPTGEKDWCGQWKAKAVLAITESPPPAP